MKHISKVEITAQEGTDFKKKAKHASLRDNCRREMMPRCTSALLATCEQLCRLLEKTLDTAIKKVYAH